MVRPLKSAKVFHTSLYWACDYVSMLVKGAPGIYVVIAILHCLQTLSMIAVLKVIISNFYRKYSFALEDFTENNKRNISKSWFLVHQYIYIFLYANNIKQDMCD